MSKCKCGSFAINDDPDGVLCDKCWRDGAIEHWKWLAEEAIAANQRHQAEIKRLQGQIADMSLVIEKRNADSEMLLNVIARCKDAALEIDVERIRANVKAFIASATAAGGE